MNYIHARRFKRSKRMLSGKVAFTLLLPWIRRGRGLLPFYAILVQLDTFTVLRQNALTFTQPPPYDGSTKSRLTTPLSARAVRAVRFRGPVSRPAPEMDGGASLYRVTVGTMSTTLYRRPRIASSLHVPPHESPKPLVQRLGDLVRGLGGPMCAHQTQPSRLLGAQPSPSLRPPQVLAEEHLQLSGMRLPPLTIRIGVGVQLREAMQVKAQHGPLQLLSEHSAFSGCGEHVAHRLAPPP
jgi:hypothetical protein